MAETGATPQSPYSSGLPGAEDHESGPAQLWTPEGGGSPELSQNCRRPPETGHLG